MRPVDDLQFCSKCERPYSYIRCRVTMQNPYRNICLTCGADEERAKERADKLKKDVPIIEAPTDENPTLY